MTKINSATQDLSKNWLPTIKVIGELNGLVNEYRRNELVHILATEESLMREYEDKLKKLTITIQEKSNEYSKLITEPEEKEAYPRFTAAWNSYLENHKQVEALSKQNKTDEAVKLILGDARKNYIDALKDLYHHRCQQQRWSEVCQRS